MILTPGTLLTRPITLHLGVLIYMLGLTKKSLLFYEVVLMMGKKEMKRQLFAYCKVLFGWNSLPFLGFVGVQS